MTFKPLKTSVAIASAVGLALAGLTAVPASAAVGDVIIAPNVGTGTTAFSTDEFIFETTVKTTQIAAATLTYRIDNPDQHKLHIDVNHGTADFWGIKSDGSYVDTGVLGNNDGLTTANGAVVDFDLLDITSLVIFDMKYTNVPAATGNTLAISLDKGAPTDGAALLAATPLTYADALANPASITVNAWVETKATLVDNRPADYASIDSDFASSSSLTFVHPKSVSVISKIDRSTGGTINADFGDVVTAADVAISGTVNKADLVVDAEFNGVKLKDTDVVLLVTASGQTATDVGIYTVTSSAPTANSASFTGIAVVSGGDDFAGSLWLGDGTDTISLTDYTSNTEVAYVLNDGSQKFLGSTLRFSNSGINLAQVDLGEWQADVVASNSDDISKINGEYFGQITPSGASDVDSFGYLGLQLMVADFDLNDTATYSLNYKHAGNDAAPILNYSSAGYQVVTSPSTLVVQTDVSLADSDNVTLGTSFNSGFDVSVRNGTDKVTFNATVESASDVALKVANVPVLVVVTAGANWKAGETLTVSGAAGSISSKNAVSIVTGLTNSDGKYSVSVTSSDTSSAFSKYTVEFFALKQAADDSWMGLSGNGSNAAKFKVDYAAAGLAATNAFKADSTVLSGANVTVGFSVVDQFGEPMSASPAGAAYSVELQAPIKTKLNLSAAVVNGVATFTFANFVGAGASDVLTAKLFTGASTSPSYVAGQSVQMTLYNTNAIVGVNITDMDVSVDVVYEDFITGLVSSTNVAPVASAETLTGTVVDSNGAGIPGAPVVLSGKGFQFLKTGGTSYSVDSISLNTDEAGFWSVEMWTQSASVTGKDNLITVTSGTVSKSIEVIAAIPSSISAGKLVMSWNLPSNLVFNTTYAITGKVVDVWGNPVSGVRLTFAGEAAALFNAETSTFKNTNASGEATVFLRSLKDVSGLAAVSMTAATGTGGRTLTDAGGLLTDVKTTSWDESSFVNPIQATFTFGTEAVVASTDKKVNAGSFKGYVALYALGYEGQRMSAKVGNDWIIVPAIPKRTNDLFRAVDFVGAGVDISVRIYIDRVLLATIPLLTK